MQNELNGKVAYVTGGSKGIGFGIAQSLLAAGVKVAISSRTLQAAKEAAALLHKDPLEVLALQSDVTSMTDEAAAIKSVTSHFGKLDILIANAGVGFFAPIDQLKEEEWNSTINTNLTGVFNSVKASIPFLKDTNGYIITISSLAGTNFFENGAAYNASKFGLVGFSQAIMLDLRQYGIKVTTIMPGSVATHFAGHIPSGADEWKIQPEDVGQLVVDLLQMHPRSLPSKVEIRPTMPPKK